MFCKSASCLHYLYSPTTNAGPMVFFWPPSFYKYFQIGCSMFHGALSALMFSVMVQYLLIRCCSICLLVMRPNPSLGSSIQPETMNQLLQWFVLSIWFSIWFPLRCNCVIGVSFDDVQPIHHLRRCRLGLNGVGTVCLFAKWLSGMFGMMATFVLGCGYH